MRPSSGRITLVGSDSNVMAHNVRYLVGIVTHQTFLYNELTVYENLDFYCRLYDVAHSAKRIHEISDSIGIDQYLYERVGILSRGICQRISLARCLVHNPPILLLDEPDAGLDQNGIAMVSRILKTSEQERTVIITTHSLARGLELGERILILQKGKIAYEGSEQTIDLARLEQEYIRSESS
jgi:heme exporter protein A